MAQLENKKVFKQDLLTMSQFAEKYHNNMSLQGLSYAMEKDKVDYVLIGKERFIVLTEHTKTYVPNASKKRMPKAKK